MASAWRRAQSDVQGGHKLRLIATDMLNNRSMLACIAVHSRRQGSPIVRCCRAACCSRSVSHAGVPKSLIATSLRQRLCQHFSSSSSLLSSSSSQRRTSLLLEQQHHEAFYAQRRRHSLVRAVDTHACKEASDLEFIRSSMLMPAPRADKTSDACCICASACRQHTPTCIHGLLHDAELLQLRDTFACTRTE